MRSYEMRSYEMKCVCVSNSPYVGNLFAKVLSAIHLPESGLSGTVAALELGLPNAPSADFGGIGWEVAATIHGTSWHVYFAQSQCASPRLT